MNLPETKSPSITVEVTLSKNDDGTLDMVAISEQVSRLVLAEVERVTNRSLNLVKFLDTKSDVYVTSAEVEQHFIKLRDREESRKLRDVDPEADYDMPFELRKAITEDVAELIKESKGSVIEVQIGRGGGMQTLQNAARIRFKAQQEKEAKEAKRRKLHETTKER
jgi:hypothetical protein